MRFIGPKDAFFLFEKRRSNLVNKLEFIFVVIIIVSLLGLIFEFASGRIDKDKYKVKGSMVKVGQYRILTNVTGQGKATVVFESDINTPMQQWNKVREELSNDVKTFTYERAGYGWSDASSSEGDIDQAVKDLRSALKKSTASAPYILVGHGYGGLIMSKFAKDYPEDVLGVILIDSLTEDEIASKEFKKELYKEKRIAELVRNGSYIGITRLLDDLKLISVDKNLADNMEEENVKLFRSLRVTPKQSSAVYKELDGLSEYADNAQTNGLLGEKSLVVFTSTKNAETEEEKNKIINNQKELLKMSSKCEQVVVEDSNTYIHLEKPEMIVSAIKTIMKRNTK